MDYQNGKIYKILNTVDDDCYVGSTTQPLSKRMAAHRKNMTANAKRNRLLYTKMRLLGVDSFYIELIEDFPCESVEQLRQREGHFIREIGTLNHIIAGRTKKEWTQEHIEHKKDQDKTYHQEHREQRLASMKEYRENNKEKISEMKKEHYEENKERILEKQKEYYESNKDVVLERNKTYRERNKDKIKQWESTKILCCCGVEYTQTNKMRHCRTLRHKAYLEQNSETI